MNPGPDHQPLIHNPASGEQLSAWLDDELPRVEQELLVARLAQSPDGQARLARYGLISSCLRGGPGGVAGNSSSEGAALQLSGRVQAALGAAISGTQAPAAVRTNRALPYSIAAALALVAVLVAVVQGPLMRPGDARVQAPAQTAVAAQAALRQASLSSQRMTNYLVHHGEYSGLLAARVTESHIINSRPHSMGLQAADRSPSR